jgi:hypothetical protein
LPTCRQWTGSALRIREPSVETPPKVNSRVIKPGVIGGKDGLLVNASCSEASRDATFLSPGRYPGSSTSRQRIDSGLSGNEVISKSPSCGRPATLVRHGNQIRATYIETQDDKKNATTRRGSKEAVGRINAGVVRRSRRCRGGFRLRPADPPLIGSQRLVLRDRFKARKEIFRPCATGFAEALFTANAARDRRQEQPAATRSSASLAATSQCFMSMASSLRCSIAARTKALRSIRQPAWRD